ncbi:cytochrome P450 3A5 [Trichonephila clavata]|uniref:Cytochrome P450 3A5 n=1 Tax=Trichonephila clavata TaxID=2740835 RepID=A0A8X6K711_TRICU|nr:cytochrome P450 3A5 [Trichonephila clavata]
MPRENYLIRMYKLTTGNMADFIKNMTKKDGGLIRLVGSFEGSIPRVTVAEPDLLRDILVKDFHIFPYRKEMKTGDPIGDKMVSMIIGEDWKRIRTIITPAFTSKRMRQMGTIMNECSRTLIEVCENHYKDGNPVDCKGLFGTFTMDVIASSAFGTKVDSHNDPQNDFVRRAKEAFLRFTPLRIVFSVLIPHWITKLIPESMNPFKFDRDDFFKDVTMNVIKQRKQTGKRYNDFLQLLMDASDEAAEAENAEIVEDESDRFGSVTSSTMSSPSKYKKLSNEELLAQCAMFFMVGYETTASMLTFISHCLATNPTWQEKLIKEVDEAFEKHTEMSYDAVRDLKILDAVVSETLRMHPPAASTGRTAVEDYDLGNTGIVVKKGMMIMIPIYAMHYDPEFFQDPETFNPERFMEGYELKHPQYAYLPFGAGPRNCLGMRFALLEIKMCLANLLRHFRLKPHSTTKIPLEYKKGTILLTVNHLPLLVEKRTDVK